MHFNSINTNTYNCKYTTACSHRSKSFVLDKNRHIHRIRNTREHTQVLISICICMYERRNSIEVAVTYIGTADACPLDAHSLHVVGRQDDVHEDASAVAVAERVQVVVHSGQHPRRVDGTADLVYGAPTQQRNLRRSSSR
jgi:hypothetical protein